MLTDLSTVPVSKATLRIGHTLSIIAVLFLLFDSAIHIIQIKPVVDSFAQLGYPLGTALTLGILELLCVILYVIPRTSVLGAILLTGYLGGAIATQVRVDSPLLSTALFPVYLGILIWGGLYLRNPSLRRLIPFS
ncbi:MAG TPA: DoxX family protein [Candidatus Kapabacteria bacterium]|nr:DoxX family protein [Candidatus Kapabacteria bacterium]